MIDVTRRSIEETAAAILDLYREHRLKFIAERLMAVEADARQIAAACGAAMEPLVLGSGSASRRALLLAAGLDAEVDRA